jgi:hypothetical protein
MYAPPIQLVNQSFICSIQNAYQVDEQRFPNADFKLMHEIDG